MKKIERKDILANADFFKIRQETRAQIMEIKKKRRVHVGPDVTFYFENYKTIWWQIQEMLRIEDGGEAQVNDELSAYNWLVPEKTEKEYILTTTMMIEIPQVERRKALLKKLTNIEKTVTLTGGGHVVHAVAEQDVERTTEDGKTSSIHFLRFHCPHRFAEDVLTLSIQHPLYQHQSVLSPETTQTLFTEF